MEYRALLLVHILASMVWVGAAVVIPGTMFHARRSRDPEKVDRVMRSMSWAGTWLAIPMPLLVVVSGIGMVLISGAWSFTQAWILTSIALVVIYELVAHIVGGRLYGRIAGARAADAIAGDDYARAQAALARLDLVLIMILVIIVWSMVVKPGI